MRITHLARTFLLAAGLALAATAQAQGGAPTKIVFGSNWYAQAEHGGFYQALAEGIYKRTASM